MTSNSLQVVQQNLHEHSKTLDHALFTNAKRLPTTPVSRVLLTINIIMAFVYLSWWFIPGHVGNPFLYAVLFIGEIYHVFMALTFWYTIWPASKPALPVPARNPSFNPLVDIYITVAGEPTDVVAQTVLAAQQLLYANFQIYILNDGYVAKKDNWQEIEQLADTLGVTCITRKTPGGAKAGNINHALRQTSGELIVVLDADMMPHADFLEKVIPYFQYEKVGYVQTPQYYKNYYLNEVTAGAWEQQELFFGPILYGTQKSNATFICGTNFAIRRTALLEAGGMYEKSIAEDFLTSLYVHQKGWRSCYLTEVLCEGLAPEDLHSYYKQQRRWARGSLEVLFGNNPFLKSGLTFRQKLQYLMFGMYWLNGLILLLDMTMPILFLLFGLEPVATTTTSFALFFVPFMFLNLFTLYQASSGRVTFRAISFSQAIFPLEIAGLISVLLGRKVAFTVTPKKKQAGNFTALSYPHLCYAFISMIAISLAVYREGINPSVVTNVAWALFNIILFIPFILAAWSGVAGRISALAGSRLGFYEG